MNHPIRSILLCGMMIVLLCGCSNAMSPMPGASPESTAPAPTETPFPSPTPEQTTSPVQEELSPQQIEYVELLAKFLHEPVEEISDLTQDPYWVFFLLDRAWIQGRDDGTLTQSEETGTYGQVLVPVERLEQIAQQLFGISVDQEYIESLYATSEDGSVIFYPSDRPFFVAKMVQQEIVGKTVKTTVEILPAGDGGTGQKATVLTYQFVLSADNTLQLTSISSEK